jgi:hypothetical protein
VRVKVRQFGEIAERGEMRNGECVLGLTERDEYIVFENYVILIVMKRHHFDFFIFFIKDQTKQHCFCPAKMMFRLCWFG